MFFKCKERLYCLKYQEYGDRPNLFYILGDDYSIAIDAGNSKAQAQEFYQELDKHHLPYPKYTIVSHWHWDHTFGLPFIQGTSLSSEFTYNKLKEVSQYEWTMDALNARLQQGIEMQFCYDNILKEYKDLSEIKVVTPDQILQEDTTLHLGGIDVKLILLDSTHCKGCIFVYLPSLKSLIVEDGDCPDYYHGGFYQKDRLEKLIDLLENLDYEDYYLGHLGVVSKMEELNMLKEELQKL